MKPILPFFILFLAGALLTLGYAPFNIWPVGFISLPLFLKFLHEAPTRRACIWRGFAFGYGYSIAGTYWIANALLVDAEKFGWLYPISVLGLSAVMALWFAIFGALFGLWRSSSITRNRLRFVVLWVAVEYLRSIGMFGFPWNLLGSMALSLLPIAQLASVIGTYGLSLLFMLIFTAPALYLISTHRIVRHISAVFTILVWVAFSWIASQPWEKMPAPETKTRIRIVQGNIPQTMKWSRDGAVMAEQVYSHLTKQLPPVDEVPPIVIWPETAVPIALRADSAWPAQVGALLPPHGTLLTGALRFEQGGTPTIWNSLAAIRSSGEVASIYAKHQLVPFGEFVPLRHTLPLEKITPGDLDFSRGEGPQTITIDGVPPYSPLICYEVIFPWIATAAERPEWLVNVTNDGWYGNSPGPYQHLATARLRAIEQGLPLARAANTGISAIIDPYGRVLQSLPLGQRGVIDANLPAPLPPTPYAQNGELYTLILMGLMALATVRRSRPQSSPALGHSDTHPSA